MQIENLLQNLPNARVRFAEIVQDIEKWISARFHIESKDQQTYLSRSVNSLLTGSIGTTFSGALRLLIIFVIFIFFTFFMLVYRNLLKQSVLSFFKDSEQEKAVHLVNTIRYVVNNYLIGLMTEMAILFVILFVSLLVMGTKYALLLALLGAIMNIIPYIGIYTAGLVGIIMTLVNGTENMAFDVAMVFIGAHLIDSNILMPYIVGGKVKINPFIALVALIAGDLVWGIPGMFLFIPLTAIVRIMIRSVRELKPWAILIGAEE
jgi:predicted PurR-regulated permease PerM